MRWIPEPAPPAVVALGGGHGLAATLSALRLMTDRLTAVVTVADDGGSSGRLRDELGVLPPGDLRMALAALCDENEWGTTWRDLLQHRFTSAGDLNQHAVGNLLIVALWEQLGDTVAGLDWVARLLDARGRVLPMSSVPLEIRARVSDSTGVHTVIGQSKVAASPGRIEQVELVPNDPPACPEALEAIYAADWIIMGPGSWYTSVMPHLLVPELRTALHETDARRCITLNLSDDDGETSGMSSTDYLQVLLSHDPELQIDAVVADPSAVDDIDQLTDVARGLGARVLMRQVRRSDGSPRHDPLRLAAVYRDVFDGFLGDVGTNTDLWEDKAHGTDV